MAKAGTKSKSEPIQAVTPTLPGDVWVQSVVNAILPHVSKEGGHWTTDYEAAAKAMRPIIGPVTIASAVRAHDMLVAAFERRDDPHNEDARYEALSASWGILREFIFTARAMTAEDAKARLMFFAEDLKSGSPGDSVIYYVMLAASYDVAFLAGEERGRGHQNEAPAHFDIWQYHDAGNGPYFDLIKDRR